MRPRAEALQRGSITICFHYAAKTTSPDGETVLDHSIDLVECAANDKKLLALCPHYLNFWPGDSRVHDI